jgi:HEAT repeat protein
VQENRRALAEGREPDWETGPELLADIRRAWERTARDDNPHIRLTLAQLAALYGDPEAPEMLASFLALPDSEDPKGELRVPAMLALSWTDAPGAAALVVPFLRHEDPFLRQSAAGILQAIPGEASRAGLRGLLDDPSLELRGQAAISLARLGDPAGAPVLRELAGREAYEAVQASDPRKFASERLVHQSRLEAVRALAGLGRPEDRELLERLAADDEDSAVREAAMRALQDGSGSAG